MNIEDIKFEQKPETPETIGAKAARVLRNMGHAALITEITFPADPDNPNSQTVTIRKPLGGLMTIK